jgi:toxin YoeB
MYKIVEIKTAEKDAKRILKSGSKSIQNKLETLVKEIASHPTFGTGKPEPLKGFPNFYSRELSKKDRVVYEISEIENTIYIHQYLGHYSDK